MSAHRLSFQMIAYTPAGSPGFIRSEVNRAMKQGYDDDDEEDEIHYLHFHEIL